MINFDDVTKENIKKIQIIQEFLTIHIKQLIVEGAGSGKINSSFNFITYQPDIDKFYLYAKGPYEAENQFLVVKKHEDVETKHLNDSKAIIEYSNDMQDVYKNIEECNRENKRKVLIVFDDVIADVHNNKNLKQ